MNIDPALREAVWPGGRATLQPRAMQVLIVLADAKGAVVSRDQLVARCWGGRAVGSDAVHRVVHLLRQLSESSECCGFSVDTVARVGYRLIAAPDHAPITPVDPAPLLAVLAFDDLTDDPTLSFFSDGVSEEILHTVSRTVGVKVVGRASSFALRGPDKAAPRVAALLGATHYLDGSVRRGGDQVRVGAELVETATQTRLWSGHLDRPLTDVLALQDDIAAAVAEALNLAFSPSPALGPIDPVAFYLYLRARDPGRSRLWPEVDLLEQAVARVPRFATAWALLAYARALRLRWGSGDVAARRAEAEHAARTALDLDPNVGTAYLALSLVEPICGAFARQRALSDRALAANPHDGLVLAYAGGRDDILGLHRRAFAQIAQAYTADPHSWGWYYAYMLEAVGRRDEAWRVYDRDMVRYRDSGGLVANAMRSALEAGEWDRYDRIVAATPPTLLAAPIPTAVARMAEFVRHWSPAVAATALERLRREAAERDIVSPTRAGLIAAQGHREEVYDILKGVSFAALFTPEGRLARGELGLNVLFSPTWRALREDVRFVALCARLGFVDFWIAHDEWPDSVAETATFYDFKAEALRLARA